MTGPQYSQRDPHHELSPQASPGVKPWRGDRRVLLLGSIAVVVLASVVGLIAWLAGPAPEQNRDPFDQAVATLAAAPAVHYRSSALGGAMTSDVRLTSHEDAVGTITLDGQPFGVLTVGGKTFLKPPDGLLPDQGTNSAAALKGKWITGRDITDGGTFAPILKQLLSPSKLAQKLGDALRETADFPTTDDPGTTVNGVPALKATTPAGDLYVAKNAPYRVLRLTPTGGSVERLPKLHGLPTLPSPPQMPSVPHSVSPSPLSPSTVRSIAFKLDDASAQSRPSPTAPGEGGGEALGDTDFPSMSPEDVDNTFNDLQSATRQLSNAVDKDIQFKLSGNVVLNCSEAGCVVTGNVTNHVTSSAQRTTVTGGQVTAELTATVEIEGRSAGGCTSTGSLPLNGTGQISCRDSAAGAVFAAVTAEKKARAEAESRAAGGRPVPYTISGTGMAYVNATAQVNVEQEIQRLEQEKRSASGDRSDYDRAPDFRATDADRQAFREAYSEYAEDARFIEDIKARDPAYQGIPTEDLAAIRGYTGDEFYRQMNQGMREGDLALLERYDPHIRTITSGLDKLPAYEGVVGRGITINDPAVLQNLVNRYEPGQIVREPSFVSTDTRAYFPGNVQFEIVSRAGRDVSDLSRHASTETEVLFAPGSSFQVLERTFDRSTQTWYIRMVQS
jgi:hypothetical protein